MKRAFIVFGLAVIVLGVFWYAQDSQTVSLYFYNPSLDTDESGNIQCSRQGLAGVERLVPKSAAVIQDTILLLLKGELKEEEKEQGIATEFPLPGLSLENASLDNGVLTLTFDDPQSQTSGGACRAGILWFQIEATAKQFEGVEAVRFSPEWLFQP